MKSPSSNKKKTPANKKSSTAPVSSPPSIKSANHFPVVGIGASAGGLDAFKKLIKVIPENSGMAYVLVQHLHPSHESMLPDILQKVTKIPVLEISDDIKVQPDHIYIIPSNKMLVANDGVLLLSPRTINKTDRNLPVDLFFTSLAEVHQAHSIGVVLSGTASDGTLGLKAIKDHGGITFAQEEASAAYDGMPHSAIQAGVVDFILPPEKIVAKIIELTNITHGNGNGGEAIAQQEEDVFKQILSLLRIRKGVDFTYYKQTTIHRRILRRMALGKMEEPAAYLKHLRENKPEQDVLFQDLLIPVTSFFRDPKSFDNICASVFPQILKNKITPSGAGGEPIRIWVAGCSTGEEVYSIAICLKEFLGNRQNRVQIFATDISEPAIAKARTGLYTKADVASLSEEHLKDFFTKSNGGYQLNKQVREMCVFAVHNFLKDPPFGKMDFISCRNVLIYMEPYLQKKALTTFHYALNPKGYLLLGKSETISSVPELFVSAVKHDKLFIRKDVPGKFIPTLTRTKEQNFISPDAGIMLGADTTGRTDFQKSADEIMLRKYTPAGVVINEAMDIVHFRGKTGNYLEQTTGKPSHNLLKMAKNGLAFELRNLLHKAKKENAAVTRENIPMTSDGDIRNISIEAIPLPNMVEPHYLILFHEKAAGSQKSEAGGRKSEVRNKKGSKSDLLLQNSDLRIEQLEKELAQAREDMRSITEDQEAANEELQSANEELVSGSEELQSLNEELETGKEELQSTNEELMVVNQELISMNEQATDARDFSDAIISNLHEPLLVLDKNLRVKIANSAFYKTFRVNEAETEGKLIYELGNQQWDIPQLRKLLEKILPEKSRLAGFEVSHKFQSIGQRNMLLNAREIRRESQAEKLILLAIGDVTLLTEAEQNKILLSNIVESSDDAIISKTLDGIITTWNNGAEKIFGYSAKEAIDKHISLLIPPDLLQEEDMIIGKIKAGQSVLHYDTLRLAKNGTKLNISVTVSPIKDKDGKVTGASKIARDITEQIIARKKLEESEEKFSTLAENMRNLAWIADGEGSIYWYNKRWYDFTGTTLEEMVGWGWQKVHHPDHVERVVDFVKKAWQKNEPWELNFPLRGADGEYKWFLTRANPIADERGKVIRWIGTSTNIDEQKKAAEALKESEKNFRQLADLMPEKVTYTDAEGNITYYNQNWLDYTGSSFEELKNRDWEKAIHPDDLKKYLPLWKQALAAGTPLVTEERILNKEGEYRWHLSRVSPVKDDNGKITKWIRATTDIQQQKEQTEKLETAVGVRTHQLLQANEELIQKNQEIALSKYNKRFLSEYSEKFSAYKGHNEFFSSLVQFIADTTGMDYVFVGKLEQNDNNEGSIQTIALNAFGKPAANIKYALPEGPCEQVIRGTLYVYPEQCRTIFPNNKTIAQFNVEGYVGYPLYDEVGAAIGLIAVMHEKKIEDPETVSSVLKIVAKRAEIEMERIKQEELLVQHNQALKEKNEELGKMNKELEAFTYISSHDLQEPLRKIQTIASRILEKEQQTLSDAGKDYFNRMQEAANRMRILIDDLLLYSRTNNLEKNFENTDLTKIVETVKNDLKETIQEKNASIDADEMCKAPIIPFQFNQLFTNLISNSLKFSIAGKPAHIIIKSKVDTGDAFNNKDLLPGQRYCHISVADNGIGFEPQFKDRIFEVFQRLHGKNEYAGTGIGLAIVKKIVDNHDGIITATSELNKGARFDIYIPAG